MPNIPELSSLFSDSNILNFSFSHVRVREEAFGHAHEASHIHDVCEVYVNITGDISFVVENSVYPVSKGDIIITCPNEFHHCIANSECSHEHFCLWLDGKFARENLLTAFFDRTRGEKNLISMPPHDKDKLIECLYDLDKALKKPRSVSAPAAALFAIIDLINENRECTRPSEKLPPEFGQILEYIDKHYAEDCSVSVLSKKFFISRSTLNRRFNRYLNMSPAEYVETRRLAVSKTLLEEGLSVQSTCMKCGFSDYSHFIAVFGKRFGITPYRYSKQFR